MKTSKRLVLYGFVFLLSAVMLVAGCSNNSDAPSGNEQASAANEANGENEAEQPVNEEGDSQFPITIKHAFGETVIESKPERVATIAWANHDVALALGVVPVGFSAANYGVQDDSGLLPWTAQKLEELGVTEPNVFQDTAGLDFEAISDSEPDVILLHIPGLRKRSTTC